MTGNMSEERLAELAPHLTDDELSRLRDFDALRAELTAARTVEDGEVAHALVCLDTIRNGSHFGQAFSADELIGIITRLSAAKEEAERELAMAKAVADMRGMLPDALKAQVAKTIAAERERDALREDRDSWRRVAESYEEERLEQNAKIASARADALEEAAKVCDAEDEQRSQNAVKAEHGSEVWGEPKAAFLAQSHKAVTARTLAIKIRARRALKPVQGEQ